MRIFHHYQDVRLRHPHTRRASAPRKRGFRPGLEGLEGRTVLSSYTAATVSDLIADINASNNAGGSNTITLVAGDTFSLTAADNYADDATGLPVIAASDTLTIAGNGDTIARSTASGTPAFRLLDVAAGASLTLQSLTLQGGLEINYTVQADDGGAIYNQGTLVLNNVIVQDNIAQGQTASSGTTAGAGGGIFSSGSLTLEGGTIVQNNQAIGGIGLKALPPNHFNPGRGAFPGKDGYGGGVYVAGGTATLSNATLVANTVQGGQGGAGLKASNGSGGYIYYSGGAGGNGYGGGLYVAAGTVTVTSATLSANTAEGGQGGAGGGNGGNGGNGFGGALCVAGGTVTLRNDALMSNSAQSGSGGPGGNGYAAGHAGLGVGGGLYIGTLATVYLDTFTQANVTNNTASTSDPNIHGTWHGI